MGHQQQENIFKSTDIYQTKAGTGAQYFPTLEPEKPKKQKPPKPPRKPINKKLLKRIAIIGGAVITLAVVATFLTIFINNKIQEQRAYEERTAVDEGSEEQPITIPTIRHRAINLAQQESDGGVDEALTLLDNYLNEIGGSDPEAIFSLQSTKAEIISKYGNDPQRALDQLLSINAESLQPFQQYQLYKAISDNYQKLNNADQAQNYSTQAQTAYQRAKENGDLAKHGL